LSYSVPITHYPITTLPHYPITTLPHYHITTLPHYRITTLLFPLFPPGFQYIPDFISPEEEAHLLELIGQTSFHTFIFQGYEAKRRVASYGYDWKFDRRQLVKGADIPEAFQPIIQKVASYLSFPAEELAELLLTEYPAGSVINWHRDAPPFELVAGISLLSDCTFRLKPHDKEKQGRGSIISFPLPRRSLYIMQGPSRWEWQHSIPAVKTTRYSITFRTLKKSQPSSGA
jgi:alkylated DNA repair dioxygenase AlkB